MATRKSEGCHKNIPAYFPFLATAILVVSQLTGSPDAIAQTGGGNNLSKYSYGIHLNNEPIEINANNASTVPPPSGNIPVVTLDTLEPFNMLGPTTVTLTFFNGGDFLADILPIENQGNACPAGNQACYNAAFQALDNLSTSHLKKVQVPLVPGEKIEIYAYYPSLVRVIKVHINGSPELIANLPINLEGATLAFDNTQLAPLSSGSGGLPSGFLYEEAGGWDSGSPEEKKCIFYVSESHGHQVAQTLYKWVGSTLLQLRQELLQQGYFHLDRLVWEPLIYNNYRVISSGAEEFNTQIRKSSKPHDNVVVIGHSQSALITAWGFKNNSGLFALNFERDYLRTLTIDAPFRGGSLINSGAWSDLARTATAPGMPTSLPMLVVYPFAYDVHPDSLVLADARSNKMSYEIRHNRVIQPLFSQHPEDRYSYVYWGELGLNVADINSRWNHIPLTDPRPESQAFLGVLKEDLRGMLMSCLEFVPWDSTIGIGISDTGNGSTTTKSDADKPFTDSGMTCGNGHYDPGNVFEECEDGNTDNTDACTTKCKKAKCGDGFVWQGHEECERPGEECQFGTGLCNSACHCVISEEDDDDSDQVPHCGNGVKEVGLGEECDDGNTASGDGCSSTCTIEIVCGNGVLQTGEQCDPPGSQCTGMTPSGSGTCDATCKCVDDCAGETCSSSLTTNGQL